MPTVSLAHISPDASAEAERHADPAAKLKAFVQTFEIESAAQYTKTQETLLQVSERIKGLEAKKKTAMQAVEVLLEPIKTPLAAYKWVKEELKRKVLGWERSERERRELALAEASRLQGQGRHREVRALVLQGSAVDERVKGIGRTTTYKAVVFDPSKVPSNYWMIDQQALDRLARESKGSAVVPGVRFETHEGLRA